MVVKVSDFMDDRRIVAINRTELDVSIENEDSNQINAITHDDPFDVGNVFATAILSEFMPVNVLRTNDEGLINRLKSNQSSQMIYIYDVGGTFDPANGLFDNSIVKTKRPLDDGLSQQLYSGAGLLWSKFGPSIIRWKNGEKLIDRDVEKIYDKIEWELFRQFDDDVNKPNIVKSPTELCSIIERMNQDEDERHSDDQSDKDARFLGACLFAKQILDREIVFATSEILNNNIRFEEWKRAQ